MTSGVCPKCGKQVSDRDSVCQKCGEPLTMVEKLKENGLPSPETKPPSVSLKWEDPDGVGTDFKKPKKSKKPPVIILEEKPVSSNNKVEPLGVFFLLAAALSLVFFFLNILPNM